MKVNNISGLLLLLLFTACNSSSKEFPDGDACNYVSNDEVVYQEGALLASRINSLDELKTIVQIEYLNEDGVSDTANQNNYLVRLKHCYDGKEILSELETGVSQKDIVKARDGNFWDKLELLILSPYSVSNRLHLKNIYILARRRNDLFGWGDIAFYDLAEGAKDRICQVDSSRFQPRDSGEKGYINSFNHITAQALITSCYSEELADFIADIHERYNMPQLTSGVFTQEQLAHQDDNPVDNYVDMINNELGQEIGKQLKQKYQINLHTVWTAQLLADYLNDLQAFYAQTFQLSMEPFKTDEEIIVRFTAKMNAVIHGKMK